MTDQELVKLAANAAGMKTRPYANNSATLWHDYNSTDYHAWNPLEDDGDALRLAVKLRMALDVGEYGLVAFSGQGFERDVKSEQIDGDPYAATRRAIVRAAAVMAAG